MTTIWHDVRYGLRQLRKSPGFTAMVVLILAFGIGANTALFTLIHTVIFSPLPFEDPERLVFIYTTWNHIPGSHISSGPDYLDWQAQDTVFEELSAFHWNRRPHLTGEDEPLALKGACVTNNILDVIGGDPIALGRAFAPEDSEPGHAQVAILGNRLWRVRFGADPNIVGKTITLDEAPWTVIGVVKPSMGFIDDLIEIYMPIPRESLKQNRGSHYLTVFGRLKPGVTMTEAQASMDVVTERIEQQYPDVNKNKRCRVVPAHGELVSNVKTAFLVLNGAVGFLLLIACVNVSNLLLAKANTRSREIAVRGALGAGRWRLVRQMLTESLLLAVMGGILGLFLGYWGLEGLKAIAPKLVDGTASSVPGLDEIRLNPTVLGFTLVVSLGAGVLFGLVPAWQGSRAYLGETLKQGTRSQSRGLSSQRTINVLVTAQVALALILLSGAGLLIRSIYKLQHASLGFVPDRVLTVTLERPSTKANSHTNQRLTFYEQLADRVRALPDVEATGLISNFPMEPVTVNLGFGIKGRTFPPSQGPSAEFRFVNFGYFECLRIPVIQGRTFAPEDPDRGLQSVVITLELACRYFKDTDPVGQYVQVNGQDKEIIGIVGDVKIRHLTSIGFRPILYQPITSHCPHHMSLMIRTSGPSVRLADAVRHHIWDLDPTQPILNVATMPRIVAATMSVERFSTILLVVMAGVALIMAMVGLYSVMAFAVSERTHEIGIRMALGARGGNILTLVTKRGMILTGMGLGIGFVGALALLRCMSGMLYQIRVTDPVTLVIVSMILLAVALLACYLPARRATRIDPMEVLRYE
ncbi:MAG: hypothetical protein AMS22_10105 [Thiotrichales bacterium SG8_50]|nr:MAG: hypothetical protein AMS22_10105 [Thiotrichales bacterium SG8_50]